MSKRGRSHILKSVLEAEALIYGAGVWHRDFHHLNIMLLGFDYDDPDRSVKVVNFNTSELLQDANIGDWLSKLQKRWPGRVCSPTVGVYGSMMAFATWGWVSTRDMDAEQWLWKQFKDDPLYFPVTWDPEDLSEEP